MFLIFHLKWKKIHRFILVHEVRRENNTVILTEKSIFIFVDRHLLMLVAWTWNKHVVLVSIVYLR